MEISKQSAKKYSFHIRLWHWCNAIVIAGSLLNVLLNSTLFDVQENGLYIKTELQQHKPDRARNSALTIGIAYFIGGLLPLSAYFFTDTPKNGLVVSAIFTTLCFFLLF